MAIYHQCFDAMDETIGWWKKKKHKISLLMRNGAYKRFLFIPSNSVSWNYFTRLIIESFLKLRIDSEISFRSNTIPNSDKSTNMHLTVDICWNLKSLELERRREDGRERKKSFNKKIDDFTKSKSIVEFQLIIWSRWRVLNSRILLRLCITRWHRW